MLHTTYSQKGKFKQIDETSGGEQEHAFFQYKPSSRVLVIQE